MLNRPPQYPPKKKLRKCHERNCGNPCPDSLSPDFAALIDAIKAEGGAYRSEEQSEDKGSGFREWITIGLLIITCGLLYWQIQEMIKVYEPIKAQADATRLQAEASGRQADASNTQALAMVTQARGANKVADTARLQAQAATTSASISEKAFIAGQRAWVGPTNATISAELKVGEAMEVTIDYQNTGREPATHFTYDVKPRPNTADEYIHANSSVRDQIIGAEKECLARVADPGGQVVYPAIGLSNQYHIWLTVPKSDIDNQIASGDKAIFFSGCMVYQTLGVTHHSAFCYFFRHGQSKIAGLNICDEGGRAD